MEPKLTEQFIPTVSFAEKCNLGGEMIQSFKLILTKITDIKSLYRGKKGNVYGKDTLLIVLKVWIFKMLLKVEDKS